MFLPSMTWERIRELYYCRLVTKQSRGAEWALANFLQSSGDGERACGAGERIASARGAVVARRAEMASSRIPLRNRKN